MNPPKDVVTKWNETEDEVNEVLEVPLEPLVVMRRQKEEKEYSA
jgi:hypothetical protein